MLLASNARLILLDEPTAGMTAEETRSTGELLHRITRTGLSSSIQSSRHWGRNVLWPRSAPATKRFIRSPTSRRARPT